MLDFRSASTNDPPPGSLRGLLSNGARVLSGQLTRVRQRFSVRALYDVAARALSLRRRLETAWLASSSATELADAALGGETTPDLAFRIARIAQELSSARASCFYSLGPLGLNQISQSGIFPGPAPQPLADEAIARGQVLWRQELVVVPLVCRNVKVGALALHCRSPHQDLRPLAPLLARAGAVLAAAEREARKDRFLSLAAHELKTPLTSIKGFSYALARRLERGERCDPRSVQVLERQAERLHGLLEEMLEVSRLETGRFVLHQEPCELSELVEAARRSLRRQGLKAELELEVEESLPLVADRERIERCLTALVLKARALGGPLRLSARREQSRAVVRVSWSGPLLSPTDAAQIFAPMWEAPQQQRLGLGMALFVGWQAARQHGGTLRAEAGALVLELPLRAFTLEEDSRFHQGRVLVVDDDEPLARMLAEFLCESGFVADWAGGGRAALEKLSAATCELLVLDLRMPDLDGRALLVELRSLGLNPRVVLLSADREVAQAARELGAEAFVEKPFAPDGLLAAVRRALQRNTGQQDPEPTAPPK